MPRKYTATAVHWYYIIYENDWRRKKCIKKKNSKLASNRVIPTNFRRLLPWSKTRGRRAGRPKYILVLRCTLPSSRRDVRLGEEEYFSLFSTPSMSI